MSQARSWMFTLNNPTEDDEFALDAMGDDPTTRYLVYQLEKAPSTETRHYQGYVEFTKPKRFAAVNKLVSRAHWEPRRGSRDQAREYCMKEDTRIEGPFEYGEWIKGRGHRTDLKEVADMVQSGCSIYDIANEYPETYMKFYRGIERFASLQKKEKIVPFVVVLWGKPGSGKTRLVHDNFDNVYTVPDTASFTHFTGYYGQEYVLFDDFYGGIKYSEMLRLLDRYPYDVNTKGGTTFWNPEIIMITSNQHPDEWYPNILDTSALKRRIHKIYEI